MNPPKDMTGREIKVGDKIAIAQVSGRSSADLSICIVKEIEIKPKHSWVTLERINKAEGWARNYQGTTFKTKRTGAMLCLTD